jgi:hypothetical protein
VTVGELTAAPPRPASRPASRWPWTLAGLEARRHLRNPVLWFGVVVTVYSTWRSSMIDWTAGPYSAFPVDFVPCAWALFVLGTLSGGRDHLAGLRPPPTVATASGDDRVAAARLLGLLAPLAVVAAVVLGVVIMMRLEGGYVIGEATWRTDSAQPTLPEIAQPVLLAAACGAAGVAVGRAVRFTFLAVAAGTLVLFTFGLISWAWQWTPAVYVAPVQHQPFSVAVPGGSLANAPSDWWLSSPGEFQRDWQRLVIDPTVAAGHDLVLLGVAAAFAGWAVRRAVGRGLAVAGLALATVGVVVQVAAAPW